MLNAQHVYEEDSSRANGTAQANRPVDLVHLSRHTLGNKDLEREILQLFHTQSLICLERLRDANTPEEWREALHTIKGSARGVGAWKVAEAAAEGEAAKSEGNPEQKVEIIAKVDGAIVEANGFIDDVLSDV